MNSLIETWPLGRDQTSSQIENKTSQSFRKEAPFTHFANPPKLPPGPIPLSQDAHRSTHPPVPNVGRHEHKQHQAHHADAAADDDSNVCTAETTVATGAATRATGLGSFAVSCGNVDPAACIGEASEFVCRWVVVSAVVGWGCRHIWLFGCCDLCNVVRDVVGLYCSVFRCLL